MIMSRTLYIIILGVIAAVFLSAVGAALALGFGYFTISDRVTATAPVPTIEVISATSTSLPTATVTAAVEATEAGTAMPTPIVTPLPTNTAPATAIPVFTTSVQYVQALTDVNIRRGPGANYDVIGWVAAGQTAQVTGVSSNSGWWRVVCPDGTTGSCWVTAGTQYTKPTSSPNGQPVPTATNAVCTNAADFVTDVTVPDNSQVVAGTTFVKTWRIKNSGTCTWDGRYHLVHAGGPVLGAVVETLQMPATVTPGQTVDLSLTMLAPVTPGSYQSDWKVQTPQGTFFGVGRNNAPLWVKINVVSGQPAGTTISGLVYQDVNQNGVYNNGEPLIASREIWLVPGTACHVKNDAVAATTSGNDGRYTLKGNFSGSFCLGLAGNGGLDDVVSVAVTAGQTLNDINLKSAVPTMSISGFVWSDYCTTNHDGTVVEGNCAYDDSNGYIADGMIQPTETYIAGVTVLLRLGACASDNAVPVFAVTDASGKYIFNNLTPGTYCVYINATAPENVGPLLPGGWTFPFNGVWYQEMTLLAGTSAYPVNFGWDYQFQ
jgi:hypothetical protein